MKEFRLIFIGRQSGAIGIDYEIEFTKQSKNFETFWSELYCKYEHVFPKKLFVNGEKIYDRYTSGNTIHHIAAMHKV